MNQSNYIAAALAIAFLVYVTMRGSLAKYITILTGGTGFGQDTASAGNAPQQTVATGDAAKPSETDKADTETTNGSDGSTPNKALSLLDKVKEGGGQVEELLDGVKMFGSLF